MTKWGETTPEWDEGVNTAWDYGYESACQDVLDMIFFGSNQEEIIDWLKKNGGKERE